MNGVVFVVRQSPPWPALSREFRAGRRIEPQRYLPDRSIPGFPANVDKAIERWNKRFRIDYFTCRAILGEISNRNIAAVPGSRRFSYKEREAILALAGRERFVLFFHDDDDLFAPGLPDCLAATSDDADIHVFPLFRLHSEIVTFVREGHAAKAVLGTKRGFDFRFQSNNYGLSSRILNDEVLVRMTDHVEASAYADAHRFSESVHADVAGATVKTPCSASYLPGLIENPGRFERGMRTFVGNLEQLQLSGGCEWLKTPLEYIARLFEATAGGKRVEDLPESLLRLLAPAGA